MVICLAREGLLRWLTNNVVDQHQVESPAVKEDLDSAIMTRYFTA